MTTLSICLSCAHIEIDGRIHLKADILTYDLLKRFFISIGHNVEDRERVFLTDKLKELRKKELARRRNQAPGLDQ